MGFPRQENWSELPFPSPADLPNPGIEPMSPALAGDSLPLSDSGSPVSLHTLDQLNHWSLVLSSIFSPFFFPRDTAKALVSANLLITHLAALANSPHSLRGYSCLEGIQKHSYHS